MDARFKAKGKQYWGTCGDSNTLNIQQNANVIRQHFGQVTPENAMKVSFSSLKVVETMLLTGIV